MSGIVLVYPPVRLEGRYKKLATGHEVPPQPLIYLGAYLRQQNIKCSLLDANALGLDIDETVRRITQEDPEYVGITSPTMLISTSAMLCSKIKQKNPDIVTIVGGPHISAEPQKTMSLYKDIDIGVLGEGEITLNELLPALKNKEALALVKGIIYRQNGSLTVTGKRPFIEDLDTLPLPAWDMLPDLMKWYQQSSARIDRLPNISLISSRGCPFQCIFCARNVFGNVTRKNSAGYLIRTIKHLIAEYKIKSISFEDENFVIYKDRLKEFCRLMIDEKLDITWDCASNIRAVDFDTLKLMKSAGCWQINFGIESGSQRILDFIKKNVTLQEIKTALTMTKNAGILTKGYFIIGHPTEDASSIEETIRFIKGIDLDIFQMSYMVPFPGTDLYRMAERYGEFKNSWDSMNIWMPLFAPNGLTRQELTRGSKRAYRAFYFRPRPIFNYFKRLFRFGEFTKFFSDGFKILRFILERE